jgi:hypothetical protein
MNAVSEIQNRLRTIYAAADAAVAAAGPRCDSSGRCCRFKEYGHTLFISQIEADYLLAHAPPFGGPVSDATCPFQIDNLCTAREPRPLGCRVYFCDPAYQDIGAEISERYLRELKVLADEYGIDWRYRPLHTFLDDHLSATRSEATTSAQRSEDSAARINDERISLPLATVE